MAIAFDNATDSGNNGNTPSSSLTFSHTTSGNNRILFVGIGVRNDGAAGDRISGVTYNGVAMTRVDKVLDANASCWLYLLVNPASGSHNVVVTCTTSVQVVAGAVSYTGCRVSSQPDSSNKGSGSGVTSLTLSTTTVQDNVWAAMVVSTSGFNATSGGTATVRVQSTSNSGYAIGDSNAALTPPGSKSLSINLGGSSTVTGVIASFSKALEATVSDTQGSTDVSTGVKAFTRTVSDTQPTAEVVSDSTMKFGHTIPKTATSWVNTQKSV